MYSLIIEPWSTTPLPEQSIVIKFYIKLGKSMQAINDGLQ